MAQPSTTATWGVCGDCWEYLTLPLSRQGLLIAPSTPHLLVHDHNPNGLPQACSDGTQQASMNDRAGLMDVAAPGFFGVGRSGIDMHDAQVRWGVAMAMPAQQMRW